MILRYLKNMISNSYTPEYDINGAGFKLLGKTRIYPLNNKYPLDTKTITLFIFSLTKGSVKVAT